ncbi:MAG: hypothetical protein MR607_06590 [Lachnospiraceae bacterium]|nr:hypothetical protein [Lachnospiraceae bacterium]
MKKHNKRGTSYLLSVVMIGALLAGTGASALAEGEPGTVGTENTSAGISAPESNGTATASESSSIGSGTDGSTGNSASEGQSSDGTVNQIIGGSGSNAEETGSPAGEDASGEGSKSVTDTAGAERTASGVEGSTEGSTAAETAETAATDMTGDPAAEEELSYPAFTDEIDTGDGVVVLVDAPEGAFPAGIQCAVTKVDSALILPAIQTAENDSTITADDIVAYDFDFYLGELHDIEPLTDISVTYNGLAIEDGDTATLYHLEDDTAAAEREETGAVDQESGTLQFSSDAFSIHAAVLRAGEAGGTDTGTGIKIGYDESTDIHSVQDGEGGSLILFCMNNMMHWPHDTPSFKAPNYESADLKTYLTNHGVTDADACISQLEALIYAGYNNNGLALYEIVGNAQQISEEEFNQLLVPPEYLRTDFPDSIGNTQFSYADYMNHNTENLDRLKRFLTEVGNYFLSGTTNSGLAYKQLTALPFWRAAYCMNYGYDAGTSPITAYTIMYSGSYYVTETQAYDATSQAIWNLLEKNGLENNNLESSKDTVPLANILLDAAPAAKILRTAPRDSDIRLEGGTAFTYDSADGLWHSDSLYINAPDNYHGTYRISVNQSGVTASAAEVKAGETFTLTVAEKPAGDVTVTVSSDNIKYMVGDLRMYQPVPGATASDGKGFQNMVGAMIKTGSVKAVKTLTFPRGDLSVSKKVEGNSNTEKQFAFTVTLTDCANLDGTYGDMLFNKGVASFSLTSGQSRTAAGLPAEIAYTVTEAEDKEYDTTSSGGTGTITNGGTAQAVFTNTYKKPTGSLEIIKTSSGAETPVDTQFVIRNADQTEAYEKTVRYGDFTDGKITVENIPVGTYTVTESPDTAQVPGYSLTVDGSNGIPVEVENSQTASVTINNTYTRNTEEKPSSDGGNSGTTENSGNSGSTENPGSGNSGNTENSSSNPSSQAKPTKTTPVQKAQENMQPANQTVETVTGTEHAAENPAGYGVLGAGRGKNGSATNGANVQTGDNSHMTGWLVLAVISAALLVTFAVYRKKKGDQE